MLKFNKQYNSWISTCKKYFISEIDSKTYLEAYLYNEKGQIIYNKLRLDSLLENINLDNINGIFKYNPSREQDDKIMNILFKLYNGNTIDKVKIKECVILSINDKKYNKIRNITINLLQKYNLPNISIYFGYTKSNIEKSKFYNCLVNKNIRNEFTCGMLEIFEKFIKENKGNEWLLYFEDDVRIVNLDKNENFNFLYNVPEDAELIRPYMGNNSKCELKNIKYKISFGGGLNHAFYISTNGCKKVINYAKKYGWKFICDIDLYQISKFNTEIASGYDGWSNISINGICDSIKLESEDEKLIIYQMDNVIFNQTSLPCAPFN